VWYRLISCRFAAIVIAASAVCALCAAMAVRAQTSTKPGPMQSGAHASQPQAGGAAASSAPGAASAGAFDPKELFATVCGWCHSSGGREAGKGPKLMDTTLTDGELAYRIRMGKTGQMPAFGSALNDQQIASVVAYIRNLKPEGTH
jgi:mono/diheme cytochrome c family protein